MTEVGSAQARDILFLGECGLDPGIDSMLVLTRTTGVLITGILTDRAAMKVLERVQKEGKTVKSFVSWCGGLPEPSASNVRLRLYPLPMCKEPPLMGI